MGNAQRQTGLTLIEVVAAMALMAGVLTAALVARGRLAQQGQRAELRQQAVDFLVAFHENTTEPVRAGTFRTGDFWVVIDDRSPSSLDALRLDVRTMSVYPDNDSRAEALASVEWFMPRPRSSSVTGVEGGRP